MSEESTCHKEVAPDGPSLLQNGNLVFQAHHVGWIIASFFTLVSLVASLWLVNKHLQWYTNKREQRYVVRILLLVPIYALISLASYFFWNHATPLILLRDCYEAIVLTAFFYLLLAYLSPEPDGQRLIFYKYGLSKQADSEAIAAGEDVKKWVLPLGFVKWKPSDGLVFLQLMKWGVLQYCVLRPLTTLSAVILDYSGLYCESSWGFGWGHIYITIIVSISVTVAMYCLIQMYVTVSDLLKPQRPLLKLFAIKAVVFLTFWQATFLSLLAMLDVVQDTKYMTAEDINIGIGALLETLEMAIFAFLHIKAFTYKVYRPVYIDGVTRSPPPKPTPRLRSLGHALDFRETFREVWAGCLYMWAKIRGREPHVDVPVTRAGYYKDVFGKSRVNIAGRATVIDEKNVDDTAPTFPSVRIDVEQHVDIEGERQWLGVHDDYGYGIRREKSEDLEVQIDKELERRGYGSHIPGRGHIKPIPEEGQQRRQRSWWRNIYDRISQSSPDYDHTLPAHAESDAAQRLLSPLHDLDDPPPSSYIRPASARDVPRQEYPHERRRSSKHVSRSHARPPASPPPPSLLASETAMFGRLFPAPPSAHHGRMTPATSSEVHGYQIGMAGERKTFAAKVSRSNLTHDSHPSIPVEIAHSPPLAHRHNRPVVQMPRLLGPAVSRQSEVPSSPLPTLQEPPRFPL